MTSLNLLRTLWISEETWLGESPQSSSLFNSQIETKKIGSFRKPFLNCMAESVLSAVLDCSVGIIHSILLLMMLREFVAGSGKHELNQRIS